jgi:hypothetical protein
MPLAAIAAAAAFVLAAAALPPPAHAQLADEARQALRARIERLQQLRQQRPGDGVLVYYQALTHAQLGEREAALAELKSLVGRRLGVIPATGLGFESLENDPEFNAVREQLAAGEARTPDAPVSFRLADRTLIPEGIAWDPQARDFFVGSIAQRKIVRIDAQRRATDFSRAGDGLDAVLGLAVDAQRRLLYAVSTNGFEDGGRASPRNAIVRYSLRTGRVDARFDVADARQLNDVAVAGDGTVYATDSAGATLWRLAPGARSFDVVGTRGALLGANGVAVAPDGARVYVSVGTGIALVDPQKGTFVRLPQPDDAVTGGIDGLYWHAGDLYGVQNGVNPGRVVRLHLEPGGTRIRALTVLQSHHHPEFDEPTTGAVADGRLHVIANSHVARYGTDGRIDRPEVLRPTAVVAVPLDGRVGG